jgi:eukaryotic-like serine/threonine-protein kinase
VTGQKLLQYQILEKIGEGGMGVVYKARDTHLNRFVAVKLLPPSAPVDLERRRRFAQEARAASALNHPNIITIHDINEANGVAFICMEYVSGKTLDHLIPRHGLPLNQVFHYAIQIADALARSHSAGIVHRDLKPSNIMVNDHGLVKVLDFGVAKLLEPVLESPDEPTLSLAGSTAENKIVGTPAYMSPEQVEGRCVDTRSDIFSFGSLFYEMLTGQPAFRRDSRMNTMAAILREEPKPLNEIAPDLPHDLEHLLRSCLRKDSERRLQHMDDVRAMLLELKEESESGVLDRMRPVAGKVRRGWWPVVACVSFVLALAAAWFSLGTNPVPLGRPVPLTANRGEEAYPSFSPDGTRVVYSWNGAREDNYDLFVKLVGEEGAPQRLTFDLAEDYSPAWSPDGKKIAFLRRRKDSSELIYIPSTGTGQQKKLTDLYGDHDSPARELAWADNGHVIFFDAPDKNAQATPTAPSNQAGLFTLALNGKERRRLTQCTGLRDADPAISPDGKTLAFTRINSYASSTVFLLPLTNDLRPAGDPKPLTIRSEAGHQFEQMTQPAWTPDGRSIVFVAGRNQLWRSPVSGTARAQRLPFQGEQVDVSRHQPYRMVFTESGKNGKIVRMSLGYVKGDVLLEDFAPSTRLDTSPEYSPDGQRVLFASRRADDFAVYVANADGSFPTPLTSFDASEMGRLVETASPRWSPDGRLIVFDSNYNRHFEIYVMDADGGEARSLHPHKEGDDAAPSFSEDGQSVYFSSRLNAEPWQVWRMPLAGGEPVRLTTNGGFSPVESGGFVYYQQSDERAAGLWRVPVEGGQETKVLDLVGGRRFAISNGDVYFIELPDPHALPVLQVLNLKTGHRRKLADIPCTFRLYDFGLTLSARDQSFLFACTEHPQSNLMVVEELR